MDTAEELDCPVSTLASNACSLSYSQLNALLKILPAKVCYRPSSPLPVPPAPASPSPKSLNSPIPITHSHVSPLILPSPCLQDDVERKTLLLHYAVQTRHTFARLLATVRWLKHRGPLIADAARAEDDASTRAHVFEDVADSLWTSHADLTPLSAPRPAVLEAVDLLTSSPSITNAALPPSGKSDDNKRPHKRPFLSSEVSEVTQHPPSSSLHLPPHPPTIAAHVHLPTPVHPPLPPAPVLPQPPVAPPVPVVPPTPSNPNNSSSLGSVSPVIAERLAIATRNCIRESLLHIGPLRVLSWRAGIADVCVKVGLPHLWSADLSLDSLDPEAPTLRAHAIALHLANHVDAPTHPPASPPSISPTPVQHAALRRMADDRMTAALQAARAMTGRSTRPTSHPPPPSSTSSSAPHLTSPSAANALSAASASSPLLNPVSIMLCALHDMMLHDVCAPLAMSALRAQARAMRNARWGPFLKLEGAEPDTPRTAPLVLRYWLSHRETALIRISEFRSADTPASMLNKVAGSNVAKPSAPVADAALEHKPMCFSVVHEPPLPSVVDQGVVSPLFEMRPDSLNLEHLLLSAIRRRSHVRLQALANTLRSRHQALRLHPSCVTLSAFDPPLPAKIPFPVPSPVTPDHILNVRFSASDPVGLEIRIFAMSGGVLVRAYGAAAIALAVRRPKSCGELWSRPQHFKTSDEEAESIVSVFETVRSRVKLNAAARSLSALDIGVSCTLPPGTASVAGTASPEKAASQLVPPFAPLERRAPRRFLTLSPPPPAKDVLANLHGGGPASKVRLSGSRSLDRSGPTKRPRLTYATTSDALVFIQESSFAGEDWQVGPRSSEKGVVSVNGSGQVNETDFIDRYSCTAAAAAAWAVTRDIVERRLRRDSLLRAFVQTSVASAAQMHHMKSSEGGDLHLDSASRVLLKVKCEPLPVRRAELLLRGYDAWQVRLSLLPSIFDSTDSFQANNNGKRKRGKGGGNLWSVGVSCTGSQLTFTYPSANTDTVRSFFRDLTRARTAAALARGVPPSRFYRVLRRSPVRIVVGIGPFNQEGQGSNGATGADGTVSRNTDAAKPLYTATVEYVYSKGNSGGFSLSFSPAKQTMEQLVPLIEEALDASGGQVGGILAGLLERACPVAAAAESALRVRGSGKIRFVTALRVRAVFVGETVVRGSDHAGSAAMNAQAKGKVQTEQVLHAVDVDARGGSGLVTVIDVGRATAVMIQQGLAHPSSSSGGGGSHRRNDYVSVPRWDEIVATLPRDGHAEAQRAGSTVVLRMEMLEKFLSDLVTSAGRSDAS